MSAYKTLLRPILFRRDPEKIHDLTLKAIPFIAPFVKAIGLLIGSKSAVLNTEIAGIKFSSPVGLAAGFDKDLRCFRHMYSFGFGAVEVGTITPAPQGGNPTPRIERFVEQAAVLNRMGFPNDGLANALARLKNGKASGPVGINIGANKDSVDRINDYVVSYRAVARYADYVTVNVSSPNTPGLRALESGAGLRTLLTALSSEIDLIRVPIFLKVSPDLNNDEIDETCSILIESKIGAVIVGNTTTQRPVSHGFPEITGEGGLSGKPLRSISVDALRRFSAKLRGQIPLVSVGGIFGAEDVLERIQAGASFVQLYTSLIYEGPLLVHRINAALAKELKERGLTTLQELRDRKPSALQKLTHLATPPPLSGKSVLVA